MRQHRGLFAFNQRIEISMKIELSKPFASNGKVDEFDVKQMKKALNRLGYYQPYEKVGITGMADTDVFDALKAFQKDHGLSATGSAKPDDETVQKINEEASKTPEGEYIWRTVEDDRVRNAHAQYNRTVRNWSDDPDPGEEFNCRCWAEPVKNQSDIYYPTIEPFYPELFLIPLLRVGRLYKLWKLWLNAKNTDWVLGKYKSETRWGNQLRNRDWSPEQITEAIKYGKRYPAPNKVNPGNTATRYQYKDRFVVRDDQTREILQVSGDGIFKPNIVGE